MRNAAVAVAVLLCASVAVAADTQFSIFLSNPGWGETKGNTQWSGGFGVALSRSWSSRWASEIAVAAEQYHGPYTYFEVQPLPNPVQYVPVTARRAFRVFPVDLTTQVRFPNSSRWTPYLNAGVRYVAAPDGSRSTALAPIPGGNYAVVHGGFPYVGDRTSAELGLGASLRLTPHLGMRFDLNRLLRTNGVNYDPLTKGSVGLTWKF